MANYIDLIIMTILTLPIMLLLVLNWLSEKHYNVYKKLYKKSVLVRSFVKTFQD